MSTAYPAGEAQYCAENHKVSTPISRHLSDTHLLNITFVRYQNEREVFVTSQKTQENYNAKAMIES